MSLAIRSRIDVDRRIRRLRGEYGSFPVRSITMENDPDFFEHGRRLIETGHSGDAGALVWNDDGQLLLVYHPDSEAWGPPGGGHEPGERFEETARREVSEETSIECRPVSVFHATRKRFVHEADPEQRGYLLQVVFVAEYVSGQPDPTEDDEISRADWFDRPPERSADVVAPGSGVWEHIDTYSSD